MVEEWWIGLIFIVIGVLMLIAEAASPGFFIAVPATVLIFLGAIGMVTPGFYLSPYAPIVVVVVTIPITIATMYLYRWLAPPAPPTTTVGHSLVGKRGIVQAPIVPNTIKGKVRIDHQTWSATSKRPIEKDAVIQVVESRGVHVIVEEVKEE